MDPVTGTWLPWSSPKLLAAGKQMVHSTCTVLQLYPRSGESQVDGR